MLKKNDLVKQFELVVQQEIKNHNDSILETNISINNLRADLNKLSSKSDERLARLDSRIVELETRQKILNKELNDLQYRFDSYINDSTVSSNRDIKLRQELIESLEISQNNYHQLQKQQSEINEKNLDFFKNIGNSIKSLNFSIQRLERTFDKKLTNTREQIISSASEEARQEKEQLEKKINTQNIDFESLLTEIRVYKKNAFVMEKKIENLYTLVQRLQGK